MSGLVFLDLGLCLGLLDVVFLGLGLCLGLCLGFLAFRVLFRV